MKWVRMAVRLLVATVVVVGVGVGLLLVRHENDGAAVRSEAATTTAIPVTLAPVLETEFVRAVTVSGDVKPASFALVSARVPGTLDVVLVDEGDAVIGGKTVLFRTDSENLARSVEVAEHEEEVATSALTEAEAGKTRKEATLAQAKLDLDRTRRLVAEGAATPHQLELAETIHTEASADLVHAQAVIDLARARRRQTASRLGIAKKDLADSEVVAPVDGVVVKRFREPGETVAPGTPVVRIEDLRVVDLVALLTEDVYSEVVPGKTRVEACLGGRDLPPVVVTRRSPVVHPNLRNFGIEARVEDPSAGLVPGRRIDLKVVLESHRGLGLPRSAVVRRGGRTVVFRMEDGRARAVGVETGLATDDHVEILSGVLPAGTEVLVEGQEWVEEGDLVRRAEEE